jgi:hypothetical protein
MPITAGRTAPLLLPASGSFSPTSVAIFCLTALMDETLQ